MDAKTKDILLAPFNPPPGGVFKLFVAPNRAGDCGGCGLPLTGNAMVVPGIAGLHCSVSCVETTLFSTGRCRWCGNKMDNAYTSVDSRLCSEDCSQSYYAHVLGDRTAALGTGHRFLLWLQAHQPEIYAKLAELSNKPLPRQGDKQLKLQAGRPRKHFSKTALKLARRKRNSTYYQRRKEGARAAQQEALASALESAMPDAALSSAK